MLDAIRKFLHLEAASAILLIVGMALAMVLANSPLHGYYDALLGTRAAVSPGEFSIDKPLLLWINDGLMALFFFWVGLEIKRELLTGELSSPKKAALEDRLGHRCGRLAAVVRAPRVVDLDQHHVLRLRGREEPHERGRVARRVAPTGKAPRGPRNEFFYFSDDGDLLGLRQGDWKLVFAEQRAQRFDVWRDPFVTLRIPKLFHLRRDPFERADPDSNGYNVWWDAKIASQGQLGSVVVHRFIETFREFPPRQRPASFTVDQIMEQFKRAPGPPPR